MTIRPLHRFTSQQCDIMRVALKSHFMVLVDAMWDASTGAGVMACIDSMSALIGAYEMLWTTADERSLVADEAHVLREEMRSTSRDRIAAFGEI